MTGAQLEAYLDGLRYCVRVLEEDAARARRISREPDDFRALEARNLETGARVLVAELRKASITRPGPRKARR